jgi:hypothetical protein
VNCPGCDSDQASLSTTKVKFEWNYISAFYIYQCGGDRDKCSSSCSGGDGAGAATAAAKVKNGWKYISASHIYQHGLDGDKCRSNVVVVVVFVVVSVP